MTKRSALIPDVTALRRKGRNTAARTVTMRAEAWNCIAAAAMPDARPHCAKAWLKQHSTISSQLLRPGTVAAPTFTALCNRRDARHPLRRSALRPFLATVERQPRLPLNY